jgi:hypothetical protein
MAKKKELKTTNDLITLSEAAAMRGTSISAISHLVRRGRLRSVERYGKTLVYKSEIATFEPDKGGRPPKEEAG